MKKWGLVLLLGSVIFGFQNCAKTNLNESTTQNPNLANGQFNKTDAKDFKKVTLPDYNNNQYLDLDLRSGKVTVFENLGEIRGDQYCISEDELKEVQVLLNDSQVCDPVADVSKIEGQVCTMIYQYPYAILSDGKLEIKLGEKHSGCDVPVDLCGDSPVKLKFFIDKILKNLKNKSC